MSGPGRFITIEGLEGAGKSSCLDFVRSHLAAAGHPPLMTREPGGTPLAEAIRELLLDHRFAGMDVSTEVLLVFAARAEHLSKVIRPALARGEWVVCDRFTDATYAYQGGGRELGADRVAALEAWTQGELRPDLTVLLDVPVSIGRDRASQRGAPDRFEVERDAFFERARTAYLAQAEAEPERVHVVDASLPVKSVQSQLERILDAFLGRNERG
ncbi:dTMP kinase [Ectothiorhodospiraceae bacterium WFHF3C12]|nr:dTMP kinase [Ectothiorhodospiraceae bacterium WFHF3C12]